MEHRFLLLRDGYDRDYEGDTLVEPELIFFAQDNDGNVWHFGQYRETYTETEFLGGKPGSPASKVRGQGS